MRLYLTQHGKAMTEEQDPERPLTAEGEADVRRVIELAPAFGRITAWRLVHSGKARARQTAELWANALGLPVEPADGLAPMDDPAIWAERLASESTDVMLAGHLPHLARLTSLLVVGDADRAVVAFQPAGLVMLESSPQGWTVGLVLPPAG